MDERNRQNMPGTRATGNVSGRNRPGGRRRRGNSRRRRQRALIIRGFIFIVLAVVILSAALLWKKYGPSKTQADLNEYYGITDKEQLAVVVDNEIPESKGRIFDGKVYLEYSVVRDCINSRFYWDHNENILLYTLPEDMVSVNVGSREYTVSKEKKSEKYVIVKTEGETAYIALDFVKKYTDIEYKMYKNPQRVMVETNWNKRAATVKRSSAVRRLAGVKSPVLREAAKKETVYVIGEEGKWKKVRTQDGMIGYIRANALKNERKESVKRSFKEPVFKNISKDYTINMVWHQVTSRTANSGILKTIAGTKGLTTISPTWFTVKDTKGNLSSIASSQYVNYAHQSNIEVWGLVRNFDPIGGQGISTSDQTFELLSRTSSRKNLINQLISEALQVGLDGINVDFETISEETGEHYIQFIRELSVKCRNNGIILSVDNYVPKGYNRHYHRKEQGIVADYVIIMGYDEHFAGSYESGSVASLAYVKDGIEQTLKEVPAEKVINAVPFYTRLWKEVPKTEAMLAKQKGTEAANYPLQVTSQTYSMKNAADLVKDMGAEVTWDKAAGQNYAQWETGGAVYKIWLEDESSIQEKLKLMKEHRLAGTAAWKLGFESRNIWDVILKYVN